MLRSASAMLKENPLIPARPQGVSEVNNGVTYLHHVLFSTSHGHVIVLDIRLLQFVADDQQSKPGAAVAAASGNLLETISGLIPGLLYLNL